MNESASMDRRAALTTLGLAGLGAATLGSSANAADAAAPALPAGMFGWDAAKGEYVLPPLPYAYDALEPQIDAETMRIHHDKHHAGYVKGLNAALAALKDARADHDAEYVKAWSRNLAFNGAGHVNHCIFWRVMAPAGKGGGGTPTGALARAIDKDFGSFDNFAWQFKSASGAVEGSGWGWLVHEPIADKLMVLQFEKHQNQYFTGVTPILGVDVWEHAYYLKYQNKRGDYVSAFMDIINWPFVAELYAHAKA